MNQNSEQKRAILAVVISGVILFSWQYFFAPKQSGSAVKEQSKKLVEDKAGVTTTTPTVGASPIGTSTAVPTDTIVELVQLNNGQTKYTIYSDLSFKVIETEFASESSELVLGKDSKVKLIFESNNMANTFNLSLASKTDTAFKAIDSSKGIEIAGELDSEGRLNFIVSGLSSGKIGLDYNIQAQKNDNGTVRHYAYLADDLNTIAIEDGTDGKKEGLIKWFAVDYFYHIFAVVFPVKTAVVMESEANSPLQLILPEVKSEHRFYVAFLRKDYDVLTKRGDGLQRSVDFGVFSFLAVPTLRGLQFIYDFFPNYGVAIILLTLLVRLLTFPLQYKSFKSMKQMQTVQPELAAIREKFKDDPQQMQRASMELFKKAGVNPLGGCLPLLLQMPVFFAFYKVLQNAVELVGAPFMFWVQDLSVKDPFYVLPVLMTGSMFLQQKMTPTTTADPVQKKMMLFMPLIFGFIMKDLPAGLTLYMLVSTVLGIVQQLYIYKRP